MLSLQQRFAYCLYCSLMLLLLSSLGYLSCVCLYSNTLKLIRKVVKVFMSLVKTISVVARNLVIKQHIFQNLPPAYIMHDDGSLFIMRVQISYNANMRK